MDREPESPAPSAGEADEGPGPKRRKLTAQTVLGVTKDLTAAASVGAALGFNVAARCRDAGFWLAKRAVETAGLTETPMGSVMAVAEAATTMGMKLSESITRTSLDTTHMLLETSGVEGGQMWDATATLVLGSDAAASISTFAMLLRRFSRDFEPELSIPQIIASLQIIARIQRCRLSLTQPHAQSKNSDPMSLPSAVKRYMRFSAATYGSAALKALGAYDILRPNDDNLAAAHVAGVSKEDVLIVQGSSAVFCPGYAILLDTAECSVVIAVRGTMRLQDVLTDLACESVPLASNPEHRVHRGFQEAAKRLFGLTERLVVDALERQGWSSLVICGHSLGASVASLLCLEWRAALPETCMVRGYAYAAPCTLSLKAAREMKGLVCSVAIGHDMVPRFCLGAVQDLQWAVMKVSLLGAHAEHLCAELEQAVQQGAIPPPAGVDLMNQLADRRAERLYPPGKIMHVRGERERHVVTCDPEEFSELILCGSMFSSHMPTKYLSACEECSLQPAL